MDKFDVGTKFEISSTLSNDVDTTESEGEEAKPVTVRFARRENAVKSQKKFRHKLSYTEAMENHKSSRVWDNVSYYGVMSEEAKEERGLLFAEKDDQRGRFCLSEEKYLDSISLKKDYGEEVTGNGTSGLPIGVVSLEQIKTLPLKRQVKEKLLLQKYIPQYIYTVFEAKKYSNPPQTTPKKPHPPPSLNICCLFSRY